MRRGHKTHASGQNPCYGDGVPRLALLAAALLIAAAGPLGCGGKTKHDVYMEGLKIEGDAERGVCKLHFGDGQMMQALSGDRLQDCLRATDEALELYDKAAEMGLEDADFKKVHARAKDRKAKLEGMLTQVRSMERDQNPPTM